MPRAATAATQPAASEPTPVGGTAVPPHRCRTAENAHRLAAASDASRGHDGSQRPHVLDASTLKERGSSQSKESGERIKAELDALLADRGIDHKSISRSVNKSMS